MSILSSGTSNTTALVYTSDTTGNLAFQINGTTEAMRITTGGNVGVGTITPLSKFHVVGGQQYVTGSTSSGAYSRWYNNAQTTGDLQIGQGWSSGSDNTGFVLNNSNADLLFGTNGTERMRIDSSGNLLVGITSTLLANCNSFVNNTTAGNAPQLIVRNAQSTAGNYWKIGATADASPYMIVYNASNAGVYMGYGATGWSGSSDETLKENLTPIENAIDKVNTLRTVIGNFIADKEKTKHPFLIAQDVEKVLPEAVSKNPDGKLGIAYTDVIPLLVASIKELNAKVDAQAAEIAALKGNN